MLKDTLKFLNFEGFIPLLQMLPRPTLLVPMERSVSRILANTTVNVFFRDEETV